MTEEAQPWPDEEGKKHCNAKLIRNGVTKYCKKWTEEGRARCKWHGGKTLQGVQHPNFKHGLFANPDNLGDLGVTLKEVAERYAQGGDKSYIDLKKEIVLVDTLLTMHLNKLKDPKAELDQKALLEVVKTLRDLKESFNRIQNGVKFVLSIERVQLVMLKVIGIVQRHVEDPKIRESIGTDLMDVRL